MRAGYYQDIKKQKKALKASVKNTKLDNALYGSDFKMEYKLNSFSNSLESTVVPSATNVTSAVTIKNVNPSVSRDLSAGVPIAPPTATVTRIEPNTLAKTNISNTVPKMSFLDELREKLKQPNLKDSNQRELPLVPPKNYTMIDELKERVLNPNLKKTVIQSNVIPNTIATTSDSPIISPPKIEIKSKIPNDITSTNVPVNTVNPKTRALSSARVIKVENDNDLNEVKGSLDSIITKIENEDNVKETANDGESYQEMARKIISKRNSASTTGTPYLKTGEPDNKCRFRIRPKSSGSNYYTFKIMWKGPNGKEKEKNITETNSTVNGKTYSLYGTLSNMLATTIKTPENVNFNPKPGQTTGLGLESNNTKVIWKHNRNSPGFGKNHRFVLISPFMKGNIRYYGSPNRAAILSYNNASPAFLNIVRDIVNDGTFKSEDYRKVAPKEAHAANVFIKSTKPLVPSGVSFFEHNAADVYDLRERYRVLVGELSAGNQGSLIKGEMIDILQKLQRLKVLSESKVKNLINGLKEL